MATYTEAPIIKRQYFDNSGDPLASGKLYTVEAGGTYPADAVTVYQTANGTAHTNPIILDSAGRISGSSEIFLDPSQSYKFILAASTSDYTSPLWTQDLIAAVPPSTVNVDIQGLAGENLAAGDCIYLALGTEGSTVAGSWYKADADVAVKSSSAVSVGFAVLAITSGSSGTIRLEGDITLTGLSPGASYYVSATAGGVTSTAPTNARFVGQAQSTTSLVIVPNPPIATIVDPLLKTLCNGRLTLTTGTPITTADVTAATTLYWTPYQGNEIALYSGTAWVTFAQAQLSIAVPATTSQMYDVFVDYNSGTPALSLTAWSSDTARATALTTQDGIYVLTGSTGKRYVGSFRTTGVSGQTEDSFAKRYLWNYYHRVQRPMRVIDSTNSWTYDATAFQQANAAAANQLDVVIGVAEVMLDVHVIGLFSHSAGSTAGVGIGEDSTTVTATGTIGMRGFSGGTLVSQASAILRKYPAIGRHVYVWLESGGGATTTFYGDNNLPTIEQSGIHGSIPG